MGEPNAERYTPSGISTCMSNPVCGNSPTRCAATPWPMGPDPADVAEAVGLTALKRLPASEARKPPRRASRSVNTAESRSSISIAASDTFNVSATSVKSTGGKK